jgi:hypothetical protein
MGVDTRTITQDPLRWRYRGLLPKPVEPIAACHMPLVLLQHPHSLQAISQTTQSPTW